MLNRVAAVARGHLRSSSRAFSASGKPWESEVSSEVFGRMKSIIEAPSPVGLEGSMTYGVAKPMFESIMPAGRDWCIHQYKGNAGIMLDTHPGRDDMLSVMVIGHADKIRMQVRSISSDGKIWIDSDSFLPLTLLGNEVTLFSESPSNPGTYRRIEGGTVEALGAIHFASDAVRRGTSGVKKEQLYVELQLTGEKRSKQVEELGIRAGDSLLLSRPLKRGFGPQSIVGPYLDNGLGCFVAVELARLLGQEAALEHVRVLCALASHEEIGRFGSRVQAAGMAPDVIIATDVNHDYDSAPGLSSQRPTALSMGGGCTLSVGAIASEQLNAYMTRAAASNGIPVQRDVVGRDTGTDAMAGVLGGVDAAATSLGFPIRNMHTVSETAHTGDVLAALHLLHATVRLLEEEQVSADTLKQTHPRLDLADPITELPPAAVALGQKKKKKTSTKKEEGEE